MICSGFIIFCCILLLIGHLRRTWTSKKPTPTLDNSGKIWLIHWSPSKQPRCSLRRTTFNAHITRVATRELLGQDAEKGNDVTVSLMCRCFLHSAGWTLRVTEVWELMEKITRISLRLLSVWLSTKPANTSTKDIQRLKRNWWVVTAPAAHLVP